LYIHTYILPSLRYVFISSIKMDQYNTEIFMTHT
ncbi:hypothetical protein H8958_013775, partial [Nasalis larvatus]